MSESLEGTVALVTGASSGIGESTALALAERGAKIAVVARRRERLDALAEQIAAAGSEAHVIEADLTDRTAAESAVAEAAEHFGRIDTLFNNAGVMLLDSVEAASVDDWERMVDINLKGMLYTAKAALPHLLAAVESSPRGVADMINTSSVAGRITRPGVSVYNLTKWGVTAFTDSLRQEVTKRNVRVAAVEPGFVATELQDHMGESARNLLRGRLEGVESLLPEDIADLVAYMVTRPRRVAINEVLVRPTDQSL